MSRVPLNDLLKIAPLDEAMGSETLQTTAQTVKGAINELDDAIEDIETENDSWTATAQVVQSGTNKIVVFDNLNNNYGYALYSKDSLVSVTNVGTANGTTAGTIKITYYLNSDATVGTYCKLRIMK